MNGRLQAIRFPEITDTCAPYEGEGDTTRYIRRITTPVPISKTAYSTHLTDLHERLGYAPALPTEPDVRQLIEDLEATPGVSTVSLQSDAVWISHYGETALAAFEERRPETLHAIGSVAAARDSRFWTAGVTTPDGSTIAG